MSKMEMKFALVLFSCLLLLLAAVAISAPLLVCMLVPGLSCPSPNLEFQSWSYWESATPFAIPYYQVTGNGIQMEIRNNCPREATLESIKLGSLDLGIRGEHFAPWESKNLTSPVRACNHPGILPQLSYYDHAVTLAYSSGGQAWTQKGGNPFYGRCS